MATSSSAFSPLSPSSIGEQTDHRAALRVAVVSDYLEERWPSMDLVGDMLASFLQTQPPLGIEATHCALCCETGYPGFPCLDGGEPHRTATVC